MSKYVMLFQYKDEGMSEISASSEHIGSFEQTFREMGAEIKEFYGLPQRNDTVIIAEAPDDETIAGLALAIGMRDYVRRETLRAFSIDQYRSILTGMP